MTKKDLNIVLAQINPIVGDLEYNTNKICSIINDHQNSDIIIFPEMSLVGYPLMDHIHDPLIRRKNKESIDRISKLKTKSTIILGTFTEPETISEKVHPFFNSALIIENNKIKAIINKRLLPNYDVFDERRYFSYDNDFNPIEVKGYKLGILICEDLWDNDYEIKVAKNLVENGAEMLIVINASPYYITKFNLRKKIIIEKSRNFSTPIIYLNMVGGLDEIVYDGRSFLTNKHGEITFIAKAFQEDISEVPFSLDNSSDKINISTDFDWREDVLNALKLNLYDYFHKTGVFKGVVLGLSGGIDSAFTAYICASSLGSENVTAIMMPTRFTSKQSIDDARKLCENIGIKFIIHPIDNLFSAYESSLRENLGKYTFDIADENLQARIRATILMYYSNKFNWLLVSTGNKSELGVGYCTLYGDTNGGKNIPGDLYKVQIYELCNFINKKRKIIPQSIINRLPSAELRENQKDSDSIPEYEILDQILEEIITHGIGSELEHLKKRGISSEVIKKVRSLYLNSEYKRHQLVQTIKVSESAFGIGRRYPVLKRIDIEKEF
ncbi:MAG: NAD+ synthase [Candidatus Lokiarchaeota archaeon]|nr:NAD+ synthase [Candidatus Lokiarchaeota archaeon]